MPPKRKTFDPYAARAKKQKLKRRQLRKQLLNSWQSMMMEPLPKVSKYEEAKRGCAPQRGLKIDVSQVQKLQKIAKQCDEKVLGNGANADTNHEAKPKDNASGKKLELIIGKLTSSEKTPAQKPVSVEQLSRTDGRIDSACQTSFDIEKLVCGVLQKSITISKHLDSVCNQKVSILKEENEKLKLKAKKLESTLNVALAKLKEIETKPGSEVIANIAQEVNTIATSQPLHPPLTTSAVQKLVLVTPSAKTITLGSSSAAGNTPRLTPPQSPSQHRPLRAPPYAQYVHPQHVRSPPMRYPVAQRTADSISLQQRHGVSHNQQAPMANTPTQIVYSGAVPQRVTQVMHRAPVSGNVRFQAPVNFSNANRISENMWQIAPAGSNSYQQIRPVASNMTYNVHQQRPAVRMVQAPAAPPKLPPAVKLSISNSDAGIVLSWDLLSPSDDASVVDVYHLYACQGSEVNQTAPAQWKRIGVVKALPLPMACTLTQFVRGSSYHFVVAAIDSNGVQGDLSNSCTMRLGNG